MISIAKAIKWAYQDCGSPMGEVVYRITFMQHISDDLYFTIDYIKATNQLVFGFKID